jgi:hypothetical protein
MGTRGYFPRDKMTDSLPSRANVKNQFAGFWIVTLCNDVVGYQQFGRLHCLHLQGEHWYPTASLHSVTTQKTVTWSFITMKTSNLAQECMKLHIHPLPLCLHGTSCYGAYLSTGTILLYFTLFYFIFITNQELIQFLWFSLQKWQHWKERKN